MFDEALEDLKKIIDCKGAVLTDNTGDPISFFENKIGIEIRALAKNINLILQGMHKASDEYALGSVQIIQVNTDHSILFSACSGEAERIHIHLFAVFDAGANQALAKIAINEVIKKALILANS